MAELIDKSKSILLVVDFQGKLLHKIRFHDMVTHNAVKLIKYAQIAGIPIIAAEQYPQGLGKTVDVIAEAIEGFNPIIKNTFGCFGEKTFVEALKKHKKRDTLIITGIETHVCIYQTVLEGLEKYKVYVPVDAVSSQEKGDWATGLERMKEKGADMVSTEMLLFELMREAGTDEFKKMLPALKEKPWVKKHRGPIVM